MKALGFTNRDFKYWELLRSIPLEWIAERSRYHVDGDKRRELTELRAFVRKKLRDEVPDE